MSQNESTTIHRRDRKPSCWRPPTLRLQTRLPCGAATELHGLPPSNGEAWAEPHSPTRSTPLMQRFHDRVALVPYPQAASAMPLFAGSPSREPLSSWTPRRRSRPARSLATEPRHGKAFVRAVRHRRCRPVPRMIGHRDRTSWPARCVGQQRRACPGDPPRPTSTPSRPRSSGASSTSTSSYVRE